MSDPFSTSIAAALVTGATAAVSDGTRALLTKLATLVRERFRRARSGPEGWEPALHGSEDPVAVRRLAEALAQLMRDDPTFAQQLQDVWAAIVSETARDSTEIHNIISGSVHGSVIQARDVHGGITFGPPAPPERTSGVDPSGE